MNHDPDNILGGYESLILQIDDNAALLISKGYDPTALKTPLLAKSGVLREDRRVRNNLAADLETAQTKYDKDGDDSYALLSDGIDIVAGVVGKKTAKGQQILNIRKDITGATKQYKGPPVESSSSSSLGCGNGSSSSSSSSNGGGDSSSSSSGNDSSSSSSGDSSSSSSGGDSSSSSSGDSSSSSSSEDSSSSSSS